MSRWNSFLAAFGLASLLGFLLWRSSADWIFVANLPGIYCGIWLHLITGGSMHGGPIHVLLLGTILVNGLLYYVLIRLTAWVTNRYFPKRG